MFLITEYKKHATAKASSLEQVHRMFWELGVMHEQGDVDCFYKSEC
jgi:hypothetical protein